MQKCLIYHILGIIRIFLKSENCHFYPLFNAFHQVQFQEVQLQWVSGIWKP